MKVEIKDCSDFKLLATLNEEVQNLHHQLYPEFFKAYNRDEINDFFESQVNNANWSAFQLTLNNEAIGYALTFVKNYTENPFRQAYQVLVIDQVCVLNKYSGQGFGQKLMKHVEFYASAKGIARIELDHWAANTNAKAFFKKCGFSDYRFQMMKELPAFLPK